MPAKYLPRGLHKFCTVDGCGKAHRAKGYCDRHYARARNGQPLNDPVKRYRPAKERDSSGRKRCSQCEQWLPERHFYKWNKSSDGLERRCKDCKRKQQRLYKHKLTPERRDEILRQQGGVCICGASNGLVIDHDHACCPGEYGCPRCIRGLLCKPCNFALGFCRDDSNRLRQLAAYLDDRKVRS